MKKDEPFIIDGKKYFMMPDAFIISEDELKEIGNRILSVIFKDKIIKKHEQDAEELIKLARSLQEQ